MSTSLILTTNPHLFWNKESNRFEIEDSEMRSGGVCPEYRPGIEDAIFVDVLNPKTRVTIRFYCDLNRDVVRNHGQEILIWKYKNKERNLEFHVIND